MALAPDFVEPYGAAAELEEEAGDVGAAVALLQAAVDLAPDSK